MEMQYSTNDDGMIVGYYVPQVNVTTTSSNKEWFFDLRESALVEIKADPKIVLPSGRIVTQTMIEEILSIYRRTWQYPYGNMIEKEEQCYELISRRKFRLEG